jgi:SAM-dependent methyltransferase
MESHVARICNHRELKGDGPPVTDSVEVSYDKEFWSEENQKYTSPHYRLEKCAHILNGIAGNADCDLLDVGCGPATLMRFLRSNIHYFGIDIALPAPRPNLLEIDIAQNPIRFQDRKFDLAVAQGLFEYLGDHQDQKLSEIAQILKPSGTFVTSYVNFAHHSRSLYIYNNVQPLDQFRRSLERHFTLERYFPTSHNWRHSEPERPLLRRINMRLNVKVPYLTPKLAVEYFFVCRASD